MKPYATMSLTLITVGLSGSLAWANPAMLPNHPGYPAGKDVSPVTGQSLANDSGQLNLNVEQSSIRGAGSEDAHVSQRLELQNDERILDHPGAGVLPKVEGAPIIIDPPVKEGTRMPQSVEPGH